MDKGLVDNTNSQTTRVRLGAHLEGPLLMANLLWVKVEFQAIYEQDYIPFFILHRIFIYRIMLYLHSSLTFPSML